MGDSVVVVGTGRVAPSIAAAFAGICDDVVLAGRDERRTASAAELASAHAGRRVRPGPIAAATLDGATLVVETVAEDLDVKRGLLELIEPWLADDALIVSNTSSLPLDQVAGGLRNRSRFAGWHVLFPAHLTRVIEIVAATDTSPPAMQTLFDLATRMGKQPIVVRRAVPGYVWNRIQMAVLRECLELVELGVADADSVDAAVADGLAPRWLAAGPLATADAGGIGTFQAVARQLFPVIATDSRPQELLLRATPEHGLYDWTDEERAALDAVRGSALEYGADIAARRPRPPPRRRTDAQAP
jgi:3-hydroxybutyryl-CoA dehydrogenase